MKITFRRIGLFVSLLTLALIPLAFYCKLEYDKVLSDWAKEGAKAQAAEAEREVEKHRLLGIYDWDGNGRMTNQDYERGPMQGKADPKRKSPLKEN